jgi:hypothetical protein
MFRKRENSAEAVDRNSSHEELLPSSIDPSAPAGPRYPKPKVLLIDVRDDSETILKAAGYNVHSGTFGMPYSVPKSNSYQVVPRTFKIPNYAEQEIIVIDLAADGPLNPAPPTEEAVEGDFDYWAKCNHGIVDPRPIAAKIYRPSFDTIHRHGGVFIIFADYNVETEITYACRTSRGLESGSDDLKLWAFLTSLQNNHFEIKFSQGREMKSIDLATGLGRVITRHLKSAVFNCLFGPRRYVLGDPYNYNRDIETWRILATDKYGNSVAGVFGPREDVKGFVFVLPQLRRKSDFLADLLRDVLPGLAPNLFPYAESKQWIDKDEYQLPEVLELRRQIAAIEADANERIQGLAQRISEVKEEARYLVQLLTETGESLVQAVKTTLEDLGFDPVIDVDELIKASGLNEFKREDLRIVANSTTLLIEIKGITGLPADADALQVHKYVVVRMREWKDTNVQGLEIINHQKGVPPLGREHEKPFRDDILINAEEQHFGLMTTWDLFRLARSYRKLGWQPEFVKPLFLSAGRIEPVPAHYQLVGIVEHFWERVSAVGVRLHTGSLSRGDRVAFELPIEYEEQLVESLQTENQQVETAQSPTLVGLRTDLTKHQLRSGTRVYLIKS